MTRRSTSYVATVEIDQGEISGEGNRALYQTLLSELEILNRIAPPAERWGRKTRYVLRKRYRGPRREGRRGRSMCIAKDATRADVYLYAETVS